MQMSRAPAVNVVSNSVSPSATSLNNPPASQRQGLAQGSAEVIAEISAGLLETNAQTSPKYFYDGLGSKLFEAICELPEMRSYSLRQRKIAERRI